MNNVTKKLWANISIAADVTLLLEFMFVHE